MKKNIFTITILSLMLSVSVYTQWNLKWSSSNIDTTTYSGYINFQKTGNIWINRLYFLDYSKFQITQSTYSNVPAYTYYFTAAEQLAGNQIYSLKTDLNGDNITDFYIISYYGTSPNYRRAFKVLDITNNTVIFQRDVSNSTYYAPSLHDIDGDGILEMIVVRTTYPPTNAYYYEVYNTGVTGLKTEKNLPMKIELKQNYPNPFNPNTTIEYDIENAGQVKIDIFNIQGEKVNTLIDEHQVPGVHRINWDGISQSGEKLPSGIYFYRMNNIEQSKKMILLK